MNKTLPSHIQFSQINKSYKTKFFGFFTKDTKSIIKDADIELKGGECVLLTGKNGSGKSTLLKILAGLLKPDSATINTGLDSVTWKKANKTIRKRIMYLYQEPYMFDGTVTQNLSYAIGNTSLVTKSDSKKQVKQALRWANLEHRAETSAKCLSGGERQRVALAQAWLKQPCVLLLDEPTANMDEESRRSTEELLCKFKNNGTALLIASHDLNHFHQTMDKRLQLENGVVSELKQELQQEAPDVHDEKEENSNVSIFPTKKLSNTHFSS